MTSLPFSHWCYHLTEIEGLTWRGADHSSRVVVKGLKGEDFNGHLRIKVGGIERRYDVNNIEDFMPILLDFVGRKLRERIKAPISIVPIPNSDMAVGRSGEFRILKLAHLLASGFGSGAAVVPAVLWDKPRPTKAHLGKEFRHPDLYEPHMVLGEKPQSQVVLFDDVITSGSQMIAAARMLAKNGFPPIRGLAIARATKQQHPKPFLHEHEDELELSQPLFDIDG